MKLVLFLIFPLFYSSSGQNTTSTRVDCAPDNSNVNQALCESRGCIYEDGQGNYPEGTPVCFYTDDYGYRVNGQILDTETGFQIELTKSGPSAFVPDEFFSIVVDVVFQTESRLRVKIAPNVDRYEVPITIPDPSTKPSSTLYDIEFSEEPVFSFRVVRKSTGTIIYDSSLGGLTFADQFIQIGAKVPNVNVYGFGEHEHQSLKHDMNWITWGKA